MSFPNDRPRRLRRTETMRAMVRETGCGRATSCCRCSSCPGATTASRRLDAGRVPALGRPARGRGAGRARSRRPPVILFGMPEHKDALGSGGWDERARRARRSRALKEALPGADRDDRRLHVRVHRPRPLRHPQCSRAGQTVVDNDATLALLAQGSGRARAGRRGHRRAERHDGRPRRGDPRRARREGFGDVPILSYAAKYRGRVLRPVPRRRRERAEERRPPRLPDGSRQRARGAARGARSTSTRAPTW